MGTNPGNTAVATTETASTTSANRDSKQHDIIQAAGRAGQLEQAEVLNRVTEVE